MANTKHKDFDKVKKSAEDCYRKIPSTSCPYLKEKVAFNSKGIEHIKFKAKHKARSQADQYMRLKLIKYAPDVIKNSRTLQGLSKSKCFETVRSNQRNETMLMDVTYYEFIVILEERIRVRVIVKQVGEAPAYFWSIIPFWKKNSKNRTSVIHYGNPEFD